MRIGIHVEGNDHLIVAVLLSKLLGVDEAKLEVDRVGSPGLGWSTVIELVPKVLRRFYGQCCMLAVLGVDNDGSRDVHREGIREDPRHPRHWLHEPGSVDGCRFCILSRAVERARPELNWIDNKPGNAWPVLIVVPVEAIESWLLIAQEIVSHGTGNLNAENMPRTGLKQAFYGRPAPTREDVETRALPTLRALTASHMQSMRQYSCSFSLFADQAEACRGASFGNCWT